jgi:dTDP-4-amino-4,6-dideoxy-D-galactose acyltransferase
MYSIITGDSLVPMDSSLCHLLPWDTRFFGFNIARLLPCRVSEESLAEALEWCSLHQVHCLYFLADFDHRETLRLVEAAGFSLVDLRVTLARDLSTAADQAPPVAAIRPFEEDDLPALKAIARRSHRDSRFFFDGRFPEDRCEDLFETWIERSCSGWAQAVFVAEVDGAASGYCACHLDDRGVGSIGLIAIADSAQGRGLGTGLVGAALSFFTKQGATRAQVVTQARNVPAQRLYQKMGFLTDSIQLWYHK